MRLSENGMRQTVYPANKLIIGIDSGGGGVITLLTPAPLSSDTDGRADGVTWTFSSASDVVKLASELLDLVTALMDENNPR